MKKEIIATEKAPAAVGPYSQAIKVGNILYTAGQIGIDPGTGKMVSGGVKAQTEQVLKNLGAVLQAAGTGFEHVVKTTIFLRFMKDFGAVNQIYAGYVSEQKPARSTVAVASLPLSALVEIDTPCPYRKNLPQHLSARPVGFPQQKLRTAYCRDAPF